MEKFFIVEDWILALFCDESVIISSDYEGKSLQKINTTVNDFECKIIKRLQFI